MRSPQCSSPYSYDHCHHRNNFALTAKNVSRSYFGKRKKKKNIAQMKMQPHSHPCQIWREILYNVRLKWLFVTKTKYASFYGKRKYEKQEKKKIKVENAYIKVQLMRIKIVLVEWNKTLQSKMENWKMHLIDLYLSFILLTFEMKILC